MSAPIIMRRRVTREEAETVYPCAYGAQAFLDLVVESLINERPCGLIGVGSEPGGGGQRALMIQLTDNRESAAVQRADAEEIIEHLLKHLEICPKADCQVHEKIPDFVMAMREAMRVNDL